MQCVVNRINLIDLNPLLNALNNVNLFDEKIVKYYSADNYKVNVR